MRWKICFLPYYVMSIYLLSHAFCFAEMSGFYWITFCWNVCFLMHFVKLICVVSSVLRYVVISVIRYAEISVFFSCTLYWNILFLIYYVMLNISGFSSITLCWNIWFLVYYVMVKYLVSHAFRQGEISGFSFNTLGRNNVSGWSAMFTRGLLFQWTSTINIQFSVLV